MQVAMATAPAVALVMAAMPPAAVIGLLDLRAAKILLQHLNSGNESRGWRGGRGQQAETSAETQNAKDSLAV